MPANLLSSSFLTARAIKLAMVLISFTPIPWVVVAGEPTRIPLVTEGASGSYGI